MQEQLSLPERRNSRFRTEIKELTGASAVIEKDLISEKLADELDADILLILTSVDCVSVNYETTQEKALHEVTSPN